MLQYPLTDSLVVALSTDLVIFPLFEVLMSGSTKLQHISFVKTVFGNWKNIFILL